MCLSADNWVELKASDFSRIKKPQRPLRLRSDHLISHRFIFSALALLVAHASLAADQNLRVGVGSGCTHSTLYSALFAIDNETGTHTIRINKGIYAEPEGMVYSPTVSQVGVFLEGGYDNCLAPFPTGVVTNDADRAVFDGAGGSARSVLDLNIYGRIGTFQIRRIVLRGGDATTVGNPFFESGGGLIVRGQASVLLGIGTSIRNNAAVNGGGVALSGSSINSNTGYYGRVDFFVDDGADISNNTASKRGGGIYCGGGNNDPDFTPSGERHGSIVLRDGSIGYNQANEGAAFYCRGSLDGGGGFQPRPFANKVAWIVGNQIVSAGSGVGCAAGFGTLDTAINIEADGYRYLGAALNSNGLVAITANGGDRVPALCLQGSRTRSAPNDPAPANQSRFRLRNLIVSNQTGTGFLGLNTGDALDLIVEPSGDSVSCTFFTATPCVRFNANTVDGVGSPDARLLFANGSSRLQLRRALIDTNSARPDLIMADASANVTVLSSVLDDNDIATRVSSPTTSSVFAARFGGTVDVRNSTVIMRSAVSQFFRLGWAPLVDATGIAYAQSSAFTSTIAAPLTVALEGGALASQFNRYWCGYFANTSAFSGHTVVNDPATGAFTTAASFAVDGNYAPTSTDLRDACSAPPGTLNRDFYGRAFNVQFDPSGPFTDIGAVEAQREDALFQNGFE